MFKFQRIVSVVGLALVFAWALGTANAAVVQSIGSGSAVSSIDASADFENNAALFGNPYVEDGLSFSRTNLTFNNNGCGFASSVSCAGHPGFAGFTGNYMYGSGTGFFEMSTTGGNIFSGLEFVVGTGNAFPRTFTWQAFLDGTSVSSGLVSLTAFAVLGFSDTSGFDTLRFAEGGSPAFDTVRAEYISAVPLPPSAILFGTALLGLGAMRRRKKRPAV